MERVDEQFIDQMIQAYRQAIAARPDDWVLRYNLGTFLHQLERPREAAACFEQVVPDAASLCTVPGPVGTGSGAGRPDRSGRSAVP